MSKKEITELTPEQEALLPVYRDEGIKIGFDTNTEYDLDEVKTLINEFRKSHPTPLPKVTTWLEFDSPFAACRAIPEATPSNAIFGQHDIHWLQHFYFYNKECGLKEETKTILAPRRLAELIGWYWFSTDTVIISKKPCHIGTTMKTTEWGEAPVPHDTEGLAIRYLDGEGLYMLGGILVPPELSWLITDKSKRTAANIMGIKNNNDLRNEALKLLGPDGLIGALPHKILDERCITTAHSPAGKLDGPFQQVASLFGVDYTVVDNHYRLVEVTLGEQQRIYLNGTCPSKGEQFTEAVHPDCNTVLKALNWRETGEITDTYTPPLIRT